MRLLNVMICSMILGIFSIGCQTLSDSPKLTLAKDGVPQATIIIAKKPTKAAQLAAYEIQEHIKQMTGATLPIVDDTANAEGVKLIVGESQASKQAGAPTDFEKEEYALIFKPDAIIMVGNDKQDFGKVNYRDPKYPNLYGYWSWPDLFDQKGTLYAAYDFLEKFCDIRWFDQSDFGTDIPERKTLIVEGHDIRRTPAFLYRDQQGRVKGNMDFYDPQVSQWTVGWSEPTPKYEEWLNLIYENGKKLPEVSNHMGWLVYQRGQIFAFMLRNKLGGIRYKVNHSFYNWYDRFLKTKPDYFAKGYPDAKLPPQLCYTNPDVVKQVLKDIDSFYSLPKEEREKKKIGTNELYPIVPMDNASYCKCDRCAKFGASTRREGSSFSSGDQSEVVWNFVNEIAKGMKEKYPDKKVAALAYATYAFKPKNIKLEDNIAVQLCLFPHWAATNPKGLANDDMMLKQWADGRPIYLWLYSGWTTGHKPKIPWFPRLMGHKWGPLLRKYHKAGVKGMFFDGAGNETDMYFLYKLSDDPNQDDKKLIEDYFIRMYGEKAGEILLTFYTEVENVYGNPRNYPPGAKGPALDWGILGKEKRMKKWEKMFAKAEDEVKKNGTEIQKKRFNIFKFGIWDYMCEGREKYVKSKVVKASNPVHISCPFMCSKTNGGLEDVQWPDAQSISGWNKDNGDVSLRRIDSAMICDDNNLYIQLVENDMIEKAKRGDSWELLIVDKKTGERRFLFIDLDGNVTGRVRGDGAPQEWIDCGAKTISRVTDKQWTTKISIPRKKLPKDKSGRLFVNVRRNDSNHEDSPVLVATGNAFEEGRVGATIAFDKPIEMKNDSSLAKDLILQWNFQGSGNIVKDASKNGNNGTLFGAASRKKQDGISSISINGNKQWIKVDKFKTGTPKTFTFSCWVNYPNANRQGGLRILTIPPLRIILAVPHKKLLILSNAKDGKVFGAGPMGAKLFPKQWQMLTFTFDGKLLNVYENGRCRGSLNIQRSKNFLKDSPWLIGGAPKLPFHQAFMGMMSDIRVYNRPLSASEVMKLYQKDFKHYRKPDVGKTSSF